MTTKTGLMKLVIDAGGGTTETHYKRIHELNCGAVFVLVADERTDYFQNGQTIINEYDLQCNEEIFNGNDYDKIANFYKPMAPFVEPWSWEEPLTVIPQ